MGEVSTWQTVHELKCNTNSYLKLSRNEAKQKGGRIYATGSIISAVVTYTYNTGYVGTVVKFVNNTAEKGVDYHWKAVPDFTL